MKSIRQKIDAGFENLGTKVIRFRWVAIILLILLTVLMASRLPRITFDMSTEAFLNKDDPAIELYNSFRDQFGRDEMILVMIKPKNIFDLDFLKKLKAFHEELEESVPYVDDISSLINARLTRGEEGQLIVQDLMEEIPQSKEDLIRLREYVLSNPLYKNLLVSENGTFTAIVIKSEAYSSSNRDNHEDNKFSTGEELLNHNTVFKKEENVVLSNEENSEMVSVVREVMKKYDGEDFSVYLTGSPVVTDYLKKTMQGDMLKFTWIAIIAIGFFLFVLFRRLSGVLLPLISVLLSVVYTFSLLAITETAIKLPLVILPSFLLAIGIGSSVHLMSFFFKTYTAGNKTSAIVHSLGHSGLPITMTSITTAAGLGSFVGAELAPAADIGIFAACGVMISLLFTLVLIPALLSVLPVKPLYRSEAEKDGNMLDRILLSCGNFAVDHHWKVTIVSLSLVAFAVAGITKLNVTHHVLHWFKKGTEIRENTELIDREMKGSIVVEVMVDSGRENGLHEPDIMNRIDELENRLKSYQNAEKNMFIGKTLSLSDMLKEIHQALNENDPAFYAIPQDRKVIAQEFLLFENSGSDDLRDVVDSQFRQTHITTKVPWNDSVTYADLMDYASEHANQVFGDTVKYQITGIAQMMMQTVVAMMNSTVQSYSIAVIIITILMILLIGKIGMGMLSMIPNLSPIVLTLGIMGWFNIPLDMFSMLIGSIAIGLAVDDTIHFFHNFRKYYDQTGDIKSAVQSTLTTAGRAMFVTTLVLAVGFWLFMFASMNNLFLFGLLTGMTLVFAFLADIIMAPALLSVVIGQKNKWISR